MVSLRERMRFYKLRVTQNADSIASTFNEQFVPEIIPEANDPSRIKWIQNPADDVIVGEKVTLSFFSDILIIDDKVGPTYSRSNSFKLPRQMANVGVKIQYARLPFNRINHQ